MIQVVYSKAKPKILGGDIDLAVDTLKIALLTNAYTPAVANEFWSDVSANEIAAGGGYTAGGATLTGQSVSEDSTNEEGIFDASNVRWLNVTGTFRYAVLYKSTGVAGTSPLIAYFDFETDQVLAAQPFQVSWDADGIMRLL